MYHLNFFTFKEVYCSLESNTNKKTIQQHFFEATNVTEMIHDIFISEFSMKGTFQFLEFKSKIDVLFFTQLLTMPTFPTIKSLACT
jgi:hypothetical protein